MKQNNIHNKNIINQHNIFIIFIIFLILMIAPAIVANKKINTVDVINTKTIQTNKNNNLIVQFIPNYHNKLSIVLNNNNPYFTDTEKENTQPFEKYSELDELGRVGVAYANVCRESQPPKGDKRGNISNIKPSGWIQASYDCVDGKNLYNRSHLIGWQLTDEDANKNNLMTGTRYFNVNGMLPYENIVDEHLEQFDHHILYRVTPCFEEENLVATGVIIEGYCVEHQGDMVQFNVFVYNIQPNININYLTGNSNEIK